MDSLLESYHQLTEAFVKWDTEAIDINAPILKQKIASLDTINTGTNNIVPNDKSRSYVASAKKNINIILKEKDIIQRRKQLNEMSKSLYAYLEQTRYDNGKVYLQLCPMAFNDVDSGFWISKVSDIRNPYLGIYHPRYKSGMLTCGETKDSINFMQ